MANNMVEYLAQLKAKDPKRANWIMDCPDVGTNDFGFYKVRLCKEIIAGTNVRYDFKSAYSTNPTICPVLSRAKVQVIAIWAPIRLYVPAFRDAVTVKAGKTDYAFPNLNFRYTQVESLLDQLTPEQQITGASLPYIPANSIFTELRMWAPYFEPAAFIPRDGMSSIPEAKNAIPLLAYYDFYRNYVINSQNDTKIPLRIKGYSKRKWVSPTSGRVYFITQSPEDIYKTRADFDTLFKSIRAQGSQYPTDERLFDIFSPFDAFLGFPLKKVTSISDDPDVEIPSKDDYVAFNDDHYGELRATYLSDYYTAYLSNENVEYERSTARVQVDDEGFINMEQIYSAEKVQNFIRRTIFRNSDYAEFIDAEYGVKPSTELTKPMFLGSMSTWLTFNDVIAQAQTSNSESDISSNTDLGSRASLGFGRMITGKLRNKDERHFVNFTAKEPGYFMVLECIIPEVAYWQGFDPMYDKRSLNSLYYPEFDKDGYQDKQVKYAVECLTRNFNRAPDRVDFETFNAAYAQEPAWWEYMADYGRLSGQMVQEGVYRHWTFHRTFASLYRNQGGQQVIDMSSLVANLRNTYVEPERFNEIFANINGLDNFQTYYKHDLHLYQPLSHRFTSF